MSVGEESVEINFEDFDDIVLIKGYNLDENNKEDSNGSGKCVDSTTKIEILYDRDEIIKLIGFDPFN
jgi:hypothetical protein